MKIRHFFSGSKGYLVVPSLLMALQAVQVPFSSAAPGGGGRITPFGVIPPGGAGARILAKNEEEIVSYISLSVLTTSMISVDQKINLPAFNLILFTAEYAVNSLSFTASSGLSQPSKTTSFTF